MPCECLTKIDKALEPMNGKVARRFCFEPGGIHDSALLTVEKVAPRGKKPPGIIAKFCPFCGERYPPVETVHPPLQSTTETPNTSLSASGDLMREG